MLTTHPGWHRALEQLGKLAELRILDLTRNRLPEVPEYLGGLHSLQERLASISRAISRSLAAWPAESDPLRAAVARPGSSSADVGC